MNHYNIYNNNDKELNKFSDNRGTITDIFFSKNINHSCIITCNPGSIRGNHYHKHTTQYILIVEGSLDYYSKPLESNERANVYTAKVGDVIMSEPMEIHTMKTNDTACTFIAFAQGVRGGANYELDTYRVDSIV